MTINNLDILLFQFGTSLPRPVLTVVSWLAYRFLRRWVRWSGIPISLRIFYSLLWYTHSQRLWHSQQSRSRRFLELSGFFYDPMDVHNLISAFSKSSLNIWRLSVHVLVRPSLENFEYCFARVCGYCNCTVVWTFFVIAFL